MQLNQRKYLRCQGICRDECGGRGYFSSVGACMEMGRGVVKALTSSGWWGVSECQEENCLVEYQPHRWSSPREGRATSSPQLKMKCCFVFAGVLCYLRVQACHSEDCLSVEDLEEYSLRQWSPSLLIMHPHHFGKGIKGWSPSPFFYFMLLAVLKKSSRTPVDCVGHPTLQSTDLYGLLWHSLIFYVIR